MPRTDIWRELAQRARTVTQRATTRPADAAVRPVTDAMRGWDFTNGMGGGGYFQPADRTAVPPTRLYYKSIHYIVYHREADWSTYKVYADGSTNGGDWFGHWEPYTLSIFTETETGVNRPNWDTLPPHWQHVKIYVMSVDNAINSGNYRLEDDFGDEIRRRTAEDFVLKKKGSSPVHHHVCTKCKAVRRCNKNSLIPLKNSKFQSCNEVVKLMCVECLERQVVKPKDIPTEDKPLTTNNFDRVYGGWVDQHGEPIEYVTHNTAGYITYDAETYPQIRYNQGQTEAHQGRGQDVTAERPRGAGNTGTDRTDLLQRLTANTLA